MRHYLAVTSLLFALLGNRVWAEAPEGRSPNGEFEVVDVETDMVDNCGNHFSQAHFEIRDKSGKTLVSELSLEDLIYTLDESPVVHVYGAASKTLWRADSRFVAIETRTSKFATETIVFYRDGQTFKRIRTPYEPSEKEREADEGWAHTECEPLRWRKNGDLVLDVTQGYHTKSDGGITGHYATVHFAGKPPKAMKGTATKEKSRDD